MQLKPKQPSFRTPEEWAIVDDLCNDDFAITAFVANAQRSRVEGVSGLEVWKRRASPQSENPPAVCSDSTEQVCSKSEGGKGISIESPQKFEQGFSYASHADGFNTLQASMSSSQHFAM